MRKRRLARAKPRAKLEPPAGWPVHYDRDGILALQGDMREVLAEVPEETFTACVTDPPYEYAFMGSDWDKAGIAFDPDTWRAVYRVLKPGAFLLAFGGCRTYHRMACAVEDAGFELRDCAMWIYGSGFPKSHNLSKAVDQELGVERKKKRIPANRVNNPKSIQSGHGIDGGDRPFMIKAQEVGYHETDSDEPATPAAALWQGYGTALKPAWEPILIAQKPNDGSFAHNALTHGISGLNIDGCRIRTVGERELDWTPQRQHAKSTVNVGGAQPGHEQAMFNPEGRWPANLIISHSPECVRVGSRRVKSQNPKYVSETDVDTRAVPNSPGPKPNRAGKGIGYADADGREPVELWACVPGCPVRILDEQSGTTRPGHIPRTGRTSSMFGPNAHAGGPPNNAFADSGGASRFFKTFAPDTTCFLCGYIVESSTEVDECKSVKSAADVSKGGGNNDSAHAPVPEKRQRARGDKQAKSKSSARSAKRCSRTTPATSPSSVQDDALTQLKERCVLAARSVGNLCVSCAIATARVLVEVKQSHDAESSHCLDSIDECKMNILLRKLVPIAEQWESTDTTPTTKNLTKLFGSVQHAIEENTKPDANVQSIASVPTRFLYTSKANTTERSAGLEGRNVHPTVKPLDLMRYLLTLVTYPENNLILDPFAGSGSTLVAAKRLGLPCVGIEREVEYCRTMVGRLSTRTKKGVRKKRKLKKRRKRRG